MSFLDETFTPEEILAADPCPTGWGKYRASNVFGNGTVSMREGIDEVGLNEALWLGKIVTDREGFMAFGRFIDSAIPTSGAVPQFNRYNNRRANLAPELVALGVNIALEMGLFTRDQIISLLEAADRRQL